MSWFTIAALIVGGLVGLGLVIYWIGSRQPVEDTVVRELRLRQSPEAVWAVIRDHGREAEWSSRLRAVERLPDRDGHEVWRLIFRGGGNPPCTLETTAEEKPRRLVRSIVDEKKVFFGQWEFRIVPADGGSTVTLTEHGKIPSPFFRGMFRLFGNPAAQVEAYLKDLGRKFGEA